MRDELSDYEWTAIRPKLPNEFRGMQRVNNLLLLNGICWVLRRVPLPSSDCFDPNLATRLLFHVLISETGADKMMRNGKWQRSVQSLRVVFVQHGLNLIALKPTGRFKLPGINYDVMGERFANQPDHQA